MQALHIGIVGCGVAGASAALLLARAGHRVTLLEQSPAVGPVGAGILLQPSGQAVLRAMGLLDAVIAHAEPIEHLHATTGRGRDLVRLRYGDLTPGLVGYGLHRGDLFAVLHDAICAAGVDLRLNQAVSGFEQDASGVWVLETPRLESRMHYTPGLHMTDETHPRLPSRRSERFDLLIAADGSRSRLRAGSGLPHWAWPYAHGAMWAIGRSDRLRGQLRQFTRGCGVLCGLLPMGGGRCSLFWGIPNAQVARLHADGFDAWRREVLSLAPDAAKLFEAVHGFEQVKFVTYQHVHMHRWHAGRVVFIGDAAHAMSPHLGQGVNLALGDAAELARCLRELPAEAGRPPTAALQAYERRRRRVLQRYSWVTFALAPFFQSSVAPLGLARDVGLPWFPRVAPVRNLMLRTLAGDLGVRG